MESCKWMVRGRHTNDLSNLSDTACSQKSERETMAVLHTNTRSRLVCRANTGRGGKGI